MIQTLNQSEQDFCIYMCIKNRKQPQTVLGAFKYYLLMAMLSADSENLSRLRVGFEELAYVVFNYSHTAGYWMELKTKWNNTSLAGVYGRL